MIIIQLQSGTVIGHFLVQLSLHFKARLSLCYENQFSFILKLQLITITKKFRIYTRFETETEGNSEMAYWLM